MRRTVSIVLKRNTDEKRSEFFKAVQFAFDHEMKKGVVFLFSYRICLEKCFQNLRKYFYKIIAYSSYG